MYFGTRPLDTLQLMGTMVWLSKGFVNGWCTLSANFQNVFWLGLSIAHAFLVYS
jgi:hypothetical protein